MILVENDNEYMIFLFYRKTILNKTQVFKTNFTRTVCIILAVPFWIPKTSAFTKYADGTYS